MKKSLSFALIFAICAVMLLTNLNKVHAATTWNVYNPYSGFDHSNASDSRSIAYALANASTYDTVKIVEGELYYISQPLYVKSAITLLGARPIAGQKIIAKSGFPAEKPMIWVYPGVNNTYPTTVKNLQADASGYAWRVVQNRANGSYIKLEHCIFKNTKYSHTSGSPHLPIVRFRKCNNVVVRDCTIMYGGYNSSQGRVGSGWTGTSAGIYACECVGVTIDECDIHHVLTAGIDCTNSRNVWITDCDIDNTGLNYDYGKPSADGITAYHNTLLSGYSDYDINVHGNTVTNSHNHGIHISGKGVDIHNNTVNGTVLYGIYLGDYKPTNRELSQDCMVRNNAVWSTGSHKIYIQYYKIGTINVYNNSLPVVWVEGQP